MDDEHATTPIDAMSDDDAASVVSSADSAAMSCFSPVPSSSSSSVSSRRSASAAFDVDMRAQSASPAMSVYSLSGSMREQLLRTEFGRSLNTYSDVYRLPADDEEFERLDNQHDMLKEVMGKYAPPLPEIMADEPGVTKACLDLGCGSGVWIMQVANEWPNSSCVAVDLTPMQSPALPPNCRSEVDDINLGLEHFYGGFDVVHVRFVSTGIRNYYRLLDDVSRVLRAGGLADFTEFDCFVYDVHRRPITPSFDAFAPRAADDAAERPPPRGPWLPAYFAAASRAVHQRGGHFDAGALLHRWAAQHAAFGDVVYREFWLPVSPWMAPPPGADVPAGAAPELRMWLRVARAMSEDIQAFLKSGRPLLLGCGVPPDVVGMLEANTARELQEARTPLLLRLHNVYCRKKPT